MTACRICGAPADVALQRPAPSLTSMLTRIDAPLVLSVCDACGHAQSADLPEIEAFYDTEYRISLQSDDHDQLYAMVDGRAVYRTDRQAEMVLELLQPPHGARVLDFGAAKGATLRKVVQRRPDVLPAVFDVSRDYAAAWEGWITPEAQATYTLPEAWNGGFDAVTAHFVFEHLTDPVGTLRRLAAVVKPDGRMLVTVPDPIGNPGDLVVADHLNHFSEASLRYAFAAAGLEVARIDQDAFSGAHAVVARPAGPRVRPEPAGRAVAGELRRLAAYWGAAAESLAAEAAPGRPAVIYGAGFYGSFAAMALDGRADVRSFVDRNPHLQGATHFDRPVVAPADLPEDVTLVFAGLNPRQARHVLADVPEWRGRDVEVVFWPDPAAA